MRTTFFERLGAYLIDIILLSVISSIICSGITPDSTIINEHLDELSTKWQTGEITNKVYFEEYGHLMYDYEKDNIIPLVVNLSLTVAYFVIFQYMNKGQTLGKKALNIRVVDKNTEKPISIVKGLVRSLIILGILSSSLNILFIYILNRNTYFNGYLIIGMLEVLFDLITMILILYKNDSRGLHDLMVNSKVIKERR